MLRPLLSFLSVTIALALTAQYTATVKTSVSKTDASGWKKWSDKECAINYPANWTNEGTLGTDALTSFFAPADSTNTFRGRVLLYSRDAQAVPFADLVASVEEGSRAALADGRVTGSTVGQDLASSEFTGLIDDVIVNVKQEVRLHGGKAWTLTYTAPRKEYEEALYLVDAMFLSFVLK